VSANAEGWHETEVSLSWLGADIYKGVNGGRRRRYKYVDLLCHLHYFFGKPVGLCFSIVTCIAKSTVQRILMIHQKTSADV
jgi:hypothetical protein